MLSKKLRDVKVILGSGSPRRQQFLRDLGLEFEIRLSSVKEIYPDELRATEIPVYLSKLKADSLRENLKPREILITSDTVVWHQGTSLAKPENEREATEMLKRLSGGWHEVITAVSFTTTREQRTVHQTTKVKFKVLSNAEINYYIERHMPFDKAGSYGIQEWIGLIGIEEIQGSYFNVMGLPTHLVYETLMDMVG